MKDNAKGTDNWCIKKENTVECVMIIDTANFYSFD